MKLAPSLRFGDSHAECTHYLGAIPEARQMREELGVPCGLWIYLSKIFRACNHIPRWVTRCAPRLVAKVRPDDEHMQEALLVAIWVTILGGAGWDLRKGCLGLPLDASICLGGN
jgi:hypothetical protein